MSNKYTEQFKKQMTEEWKKYDGTMTAFCNANGISPRSLKRWIENEYFNSLEIEVEDEIEEEQGEECSLKVGDVVMISATSAFYDETNSSYNPFDEQGVIVEDNRNSLSGLDLLVEWDNGFTNSYSEEDLFLVRSKETENQVEEEQGEDITFIGTLRSITMFKGSETITIDVDDSRYEDVYSLLTEQDLQGAWDKLNEKQKKIESYSNGDLKVEQGVVLYRGYPISGKIAERMTQKLDEGNEEDINRFAEFFKAVMNVQDTRVVNELYEFLKHHDVEICEDGTFIGWKAVRNDWKDKYSGKVDNSVGAVVKMPRHMVDDNANRTCSTGLHVGSIDYVRMFGNQASGDRLIRVKVDPANVVSVPHDYNGQKLRACEYTVIEECEW